MENLPKIAVVTGSNRGIGLAIAEALLAKGWKVAGWGRRAPDLRNPSFLHFTADMADWDAVQEAMDATVSAFGAAPSALINNAGVAYNSRLVDMEPNLWYEMYEVNVHGVFHGCKAVIPAMKKAGGGHIVNIASLAGRSGTEGLAGYCGTKFAVRGISEALFKELRYDGIKVTCINPGSVDTDLIKGLGMAGHPLLPADVADAVLYCLESRSNSLPSEIDLRPLKPKA